MEILVGILLKIKLKEYFFPDIL